MRPSHRSWTVTPHKGAAVLAEGRASADPFAQFIFDVKLSTAMSDAGALALPSSAQYDKKTNKLSFTSTNVSHGTTDFFQLLAFISRALNPSTEGTASGKK